MAKAEVSNRVRELRSRGDGLTQEELAERVGCTRQTIIALEQERYVPSLSLALKIARTFDCTVDEIFELQE